MSAFATAFFRAVRLGVRHPLDSFNPVGFFVIVTALSSIVVSDVAAVARDPLGIAILWISMLLATLLTCTNAFEQDFADGSLEMLVSQQPSLLPSVHGAVTARWLLNTVPLLVLMPLVAWMLNLSWQVFGMLVAPLAAGSMVFVWFGVLGATLTLGNGRGGMLLAILILPLYVPVLLLGVGAGQRFVVGEPYQFALYGIFALAAAAVTFVPFAVAALLRASLEY